MSFEQAKALFTGGANYLELYDEAHSTDEDRFIAIGPVEQGVIMVVYSEIDDQAVRLISARMATKRETDLYHQHMEQRHER